MTITPRASRSGWPEPELRPVPVMAPLMNSATRRWKIPPACMSFTPPSCTCWASTLSALSYPYNGAEQRLTFVKGRVIREVLA